MEDMNKELKEGAENNATESKNENIAGATKAEDAEKTEIIPYVIIESALLNPTEKKYTVKISEEEYKKKEEKVYKFLRTNTVIEGFRKGKAPLNMLKIRYAKEVQNQSADEIAETVSEQIVTDEKLKKAGASKLDKWEFKKENGEGGASSESLILNIIFEIEPEIEIKPELIAEIPVNVKEISVPADIVDKELEKLREQYATFEAKPEYAKYASGDGITVDIEVKDENDKHDKYLSKKDYFVNNPHEFFPAEIAGELANCKKGDVISKDIITEHKGEKDEVQKIVKKWRVKIHEIKAKNLPNLDDEFAKDLGDYKSLDEVKKAIADNVQKSKEKQERDMVIYGIENHLLKNLDVETPRTKVIQRMQEEAGRKADTLRKYGASEKYIAKYLDDTVADDYLQSKINVILEMVYKAIIDSAKIEVSEEDINKEIEIIAAEQGRKPLAIRAQLEARKQLDKFKEGLLTKKCVDTLISKAQKTVLSAEDYEKYKKEVSEFIVNKLMKNDEKNEGAEKAEKTEEPAK